MLARPWEGSERAPEPANAKHAEHGTAHLDGDPDGSQRPRGSSGRAGPEESDGHDGADQQGLQDDPALASRAERRYVRARESSQAVSLRRGLDVLLGADVRDARRWIQRQLTCQVGDDPRAAY